MPKLIYIKNIYPSHPKTNTIFKLTYQSFILISIIIKIKLNLTKSTKQKIII